MPTLTIPLASEAPTVGLDVAGPALGVGVATAYRLARTGALAPGVPVLRVGSQFRVPTAALRKALGLDD
jgi:hypothetical protein